MSAASRLDTLAQAHPEWAGWLCVVRAVTAELSHPVWDTDPPQAQAEEDAPMAGTADAGATAAELAPMLAGAVLRPDGRAVARLLDHLLDVARTQGLPALAGHGHRFRETSTDDALAIFLASVNGEETEPDAPVSRTGASHEGLHAIAQLLPMPYLHACARRWAASPGRRWSQAYCPVCGAWPAFAELRGVERARHLRCGRCGAGWPMPALACTY
jgi:FdhE protein